MTDTVNAILLEGDDRVLLDAIRRKRSIGWSIGKIAAYYNIYEGQHVHGTPEDTRGAIPAKLYKVTRPWGPDHGGAEQEDEPD